MALGFCATGFAPSLMVNVAYISRTSRFFPDHIDSVKYLFILYYELGMVVIFCYYFYIVLIVLKLLYCFKLMRLTSTPLSTSVLNIIPSTWTLMYFGFSPSWFILWICKCLTILSNSSSLVLESLTSCAALTCRLCWLGC